MNHKLVFGILGLIFMIGMIYNAIATDTTSIGLQIMDKDTTSRLMECIFGVAGFGLAYYMGYLMDKKMEEENEGSLTVSV